MKLNSLEEAKAALKPFIPSVAEVLGKDITLDRMWPMLDVIGHPEKKLKIIHIAGTSGKTSTAYYLASLMRSVGFKVGLHVSPHIDKITERFQINDHPVSDELFCKELSEFLDIVLRHNLKLTYFELLSAFTFWFFAREKVDWAVIETGMGGLHDSTNVARRPDKICVITDIGLDHMAVLGNTIEKIAFQKAGIIHQNNRVFMYKQAPAVMKVFEEKCRSMSAQLFTTTKDQVEKVWNKKPVKTLPQFQERNWLLAYFVLLGLEKSYGFKLPSFSELYKTQNLQIPARMEVKRILSKTLVIDGAHNKQKMDAFVASFKQRFPNKKAAVLFALKRDKDFRSVIDSILPITNKMIVTTFKTSQELPVISNDPEILAKYCRKQGLKNVVAIKNHDEAYHELLKSKEDILLVSGSFYLIFQIRSEEKLI